MKRKIFSILFTLVLVVSFSLVTAVPVAAANATINVPTDYTTIQEAINNATAGDTIIVAAGEYAGAIVNKDVVITGAVSGTSIITSGPHYGGGHPTPHTAFLLDAGADGAEIRNFTINCDAVNFWFGVFARSANSVIVDSLTINDTVQGITNWGGSNWEITNNVITETYPTSGGSIAIYLGADPDAFPHCDNNLVQGNTLSTTAVQDPDFTGAAICLWFDEREPWYEAPNGQSMTCNQIKDNSITASGLENQVGIEIGVGGLEGDADKVAACLGVIHDNTVTNNTIDKAGWGLNLYVTTGLTVSGNTIKNCSDCGIYMKDDHANCLINNNNIYGNTNYGLNNTDGATYSTTIDATNNWWGHATGPYHPTTNSSGLGDEVSDYVDYSQWAYIPDFCEAKTIGFWKTHPDLVDGILDVETVELAGSDVDLERAQEIFGEAKSKNYYMLAAQLLAAKLNVLQLTHFNPGYDSSCVDDAIVEADALLAERTFSDRLLKSDRTQVNELKDILDAFNNNGCAGNVCPCACD